jgi:hypothetical protein
MCRWSKMASMYLHNRASTRCAPSPTVRNRPRTRMTNLPDQYLSCQANGSNVCQLMRLVRARPPGAESWQQALSLRTTTLQKGAAVGQGLVFKAHRHLDHSTLDVKAIKTTRRRCCVWWQLEPKVFDFKVFRTNNGWSQGQNMSLTGLFVPRSLNIGHARWVGFFSARADASSFHKSVF